MYIKHLLFAAITGFLLVLSFPNFNYKALVWVGLLPLLIAIHEVSPKFGRRAFFLGLISGIIFFGGLTYWMLQLSRWVGIFALIAWISLALFEALFIACFSFGVQTLKHSSPWARLFTIPALWVALEYLRSMGVWGFSWGVLGYSQQTNPLLIQMARITGVYGISYVILMINVLLLEIYFYLIGNKSTIQRALLKRVCVVATILIFVLMWGFYSLKSGISKDRSLKVSAVQASIPQEEKWSFEGKEDIETIHTNLTLEAGRGNPDLIIWPETAVPGYLLEEGYFFGEIKDIARRLKCYLLIGSLHLEDAKQYNSAFLISPLGEVVGRYDKLHLVPFGEYIPLRPIFSRIKTIAGLGKDVDPGREFTVFTIDKGKFSVVICFESANPMLCRRMVTRGAQLLITITNDAWFGRTAAAEQHVQITALRAVENGIYAIQAANTGVSAIIDPHGCIFKRTALFDRRILACKGYFTEGSTFYLRYGDLFALLCLLVGSGAFLKKCC
ncbi:MAG: apolipoprotein N-acyltransferase [Actinomycetota bacterium]|nr:apolipoprotein N-acyltransferase [Actinomycetota bacterium]